MQLTSENITTNEAISFIKQLPLYYDLINKYNINDNIAVSMIQGSIAQIDGLRNILKEIEYNLNNYKNQILDNIRQSKQLKHNIIEIKKAISNLRTAIDLNVHELNNLYNKYVDDGTDPELLTYVPEFMSIKSKYQAYNDSLTSKKTELKKEEDELTKVNKLRISLETEVKQTKINLNKVKTNMSTNFKYYVNQDIVCFNEDVVYNELISKVFDKQVNRNILANNTIKYFIKVDEIEIIPTKLKINKVGERYFIQDNEKQIHQINIRSFDIILLKGVTKLKLRKIIRNYELNNTP